MISALLILLVSTLLATACTPSVTTSPTNEVSIAHIKSLCKGDHHLIDADYTIRGVVVATDWLGELHKSAIVVDDTGGLEFAVDIANVSEQLPVFSEVEILCNGLMLARIGGKIELGLPPTADFPIDNIDEERFSRYIRVVSNNSDYCATTKRFSDIGVSDISTLVRFEGVRVDAEQATTWCDMVEGNPVTTFRTITDSEGNEFTLRILSTCHYATMPMPTNEISVEGVIDYSDNRYFLRIVNGVIEYS